ncbi:hypothetical protein BpHYR1_004893 [Brachionus plicatilis]|uniref:Uncharacterized protein n=1 Tax=Brachionus plicatilis TaxID=10195 RepID=A0A3M7RQG2_BRAPC|nr:hypothetical protein BpHYR1_004893 [Brachionus plicatilis]
MTKIGCKNEKLLPWLGSLCAIGPFEAVTLLSSILDSNKLLDKLRYLRWVENCSRQALDTRELGPYRTRSMT